MDSSRMARTRKHRSSETSEWHSDAPRTKRRRKQPSPAETTTVSPHKSSGDSQLSPIKEIPPPDKPPATPSSPQRTTRGRGGKKKKRISIEAPTSSEKPGGPRTPTKNATAQSISTNRETPMEITSPIGPIVQAAAPTTDVVPKKMRAKPKKYYLKPRGGSWQSHMASMVIHRCVTQALSHSIDPRDHLDEINWDVMTEGLLSSGDVKMLWFYIKKEYPEASLDAVLKETEPYSKVTLQQLLKEEIITKYKDQVPKHPLSAYMLFSMSKGPKLKEKHPSLTLQETAVRLGKRWQTMGAQRQEKYRQQSALLRKNYSDQMQEFYQEHPDARPPPAETIKKTKGKSNRGVKRSLPPPVELTSEEVIRLKQLQAIAPKTPIGPYLIFCQLKRPKMTKRVPSIPPTQVTVELGKLWKAMDVGTKEKYKKLHDERTKKFKAEMDEFHATYPDYQELHARSLALKKEARKERKKQALLHEDDDDELSLPSPHEVGGGSREIEVEPQTGLSTGQKEPTSSESTEESSESSDSDED